MTPFQTFGQTAAPSNMMFPTASYLQAAQSAANIQARGMSELGRGLAGGIDKAMNIMEAHKEEQAKFDATKKMYSAFKNYLPAESLGKIEEMLADTSMSVKEKNQLAPLLMGMISQGQQQAGRERIANIEAASRETIAGMKGGTQPERPAFNVGDPNAVFLTPAAPTPAVPAKVIPANKTLNAPTRINPETGVDEFWSPEAKRWIPESVDFRKIN